MTLELVKTYSSSIAALSATPVFGSKLQHTLDPPYDGAILLRPARRSGARLVLLPLLPPLPPKLDLPAELWRRCLHLAMDLSDEQATLPCTEYEYYEKCRRELPCVSKVFKVCECAHVSKDQERVTSSLTQALATPILYSHIKIRSMASLEILHNVLQSSDQQWDSLRRIPYSTPGRWIQYLDFTGLGDSLTTRRTKLHTDTLLSNIFRFTPFLSSLVLHPKMSLSRRAMTAIAEGCGARLEVLKGFFVCADLATMPPSQWLVQSDPLTALVRSCPNLETLEVIGPGLIQDEEPFLTIMETHELKFQPIPLFRLQNLSIIGLPQSPFFYSLMRSKLPSLIRLTITVYPSRLSPSPSAAFLAKHGDTIESLVLAVPPDWPAPDYTSYRPSPSAYTSESILHILPRLTRLNICFPLPPLLLLPIPNTPLRTLLFPRPLPALLPFVQSLVANASSSHSHTDSKCAAPEGTVKSESADGLQTLVWTKSRWLRNDLGAASRGARMAGDQAEMHRWKRMFSRKLRLLDADGKEE